MGAINENKRIFILIIFKNLVSYQLLKIEKYLTIKFYEGTINNSSRDWYQYLIKTKFHRSKTVDRGTLEQRTIFPQGTLIKTSLDLSLKAAIRPAFVTDGLVVGNIIHNYPFGAATTASRNKEYHHHHHHRDDNHHHHHHHDDEGSIPSGFQTIPSQSIA